jgi:hypothetical protein
MDLHTRCVSFDAVVVRGLRLWYVSTSSSLCSVPGPLSVGVVSPCSRPGALLYVLVSMWKPRTWSRRSLDAMEPNKPMRCGALRDMFPAPGPGIGTLSRECMLRSGALGHGSFKESPAFLPLQSSPLFVYTGRQVGYDAFVRVAGYFVVDGSRVSLARSRDARLRVGMRDARLRIARLRVARLRMLLEGHLKFFPLIIVFLSRSLKLTLSPSSCHISLNSSKTFPCRRPIRPLPYEHPAATPKCAPYAFVCEVIL